MRQTVHTRTTSMCLILKMSPTRAKWQMARLDCCQTKRTRYLLCLLLTHNWQLIGTIAFQLATCIFGPRALVCQQGLFFCQAEKKALKVAHILSCTIDSVQCMDRAFPLKPNLLVIIKFPVEEQFTVYLINYANRFAFN